MPIYSLYREINLKLAAKRLSQNPLCDFVIPITIGNFVHFVVKHKTLNHKGSQR